VNGEAVRGTNGAWCDCSGVVDGKAAGVTIIPHPENFRPCWWHARDYGFLAANPFGRHALTGGAVSQVVVRKGETLGLRFGLMVHDGAPDRGYDPRRAYAEFLEATAAERRTVSQTGAP
jgi:hypothetical protein